MKYEAIKLHLQDYIVWLETNTDIEIISIIYLSDFDRTSFLVTFRRISNCQGLFDEHNKRVMELKQ